MIGTKIRQTSWFLRNYDMFLRKQQIPRRLVNISLTVRVQSHLLRTVSNAQYNDFPDVISYPNHHTMTECNYRIARWKTAGTFWVTNHLRHVHVIESFPLVVPSQRNLYSMTTFTGTGWIMSNCSWMGLVKTEGVLRGLLLVAKDLSNGAIIFKTSWIYECLQEKPGCKFFWPHPFWGHIHGWSNANWHLIYIARKKRDSLTSNKGKQLAPR